MNETRLLRVAQEDADVIAVQAVEALARGELVILPTDTVYGLAACAHHQAAVRRLFEAKRRPYKRALPILLPGIEHLADVVAYVSPTALALAQAFWPGPLTLVLPRSQQVADWVTSGKDTVGVRVPDDPTALRILARSPFLVAVTSANLSDEPTPITGEACAADLAAPVALVIEDGPRPNRASTVVAVEGDTLRVLRHGPLSEKDLRAALR